MRHTITAGGLALLLGALAHAQGKPFTAVNTVANLAPQGSSCEFVTLNVERYVAPGMPTYTRITYTIATCTADTRFGQALIPNDRLTIDESKRTVTLSLVEPINASVTWTYAADWLKTFEGTWRDRSSGQVVTQEQVVQTNTASIRGVVEGQPLQASKGTVAIAKANGMPAPIPR